jgi:hypothetical protein
MLTEPVVPVDSTTLLTNSAKYAHYAPGLVNRKVRFNTLAACVEAASTGEAAPPPSWLAQTTGYGKQQRRYSTNTGVLPLSRGTVDFQSSINASAARATNGFGRATQRYGAVQLAPMRSLLRLGLRTLR